MKLLVKSLNRFNTSLRIAHNLATYDEKREFLAYATKFNEQFMMPAYRDMPLVLKEVLSKGMVHLAYSANSKVLSLYRRLRDFCKESLHVDDMNEIYYQPFFHAIYSHVERVKAELSLFISQPTYSLVDAMDNILYIDFDVLVSFRRNPRKAVATMDKLFAKSLSEISKPIEDLFYGTSMDFIPNRYENVNKHKFDDTSRSIIDTIDSIAKSSLDEFDTIAGANTSSTHQWAKSLDVNHLLLYNELKAVRNQSVVSVPKLNA